MILEESGEEVTSTGLGGIMKQRPFSNWVSQKSLLRMGEEHRGARDVIGKKAGSIEGVVLQLWFGLGRYIVFCWPRLWL